MNDNVEIIRSNKGGMKIIHRGYMYTVHKKRQGGGIRWRCTQRSLHCKGSISTGNGPPSVNMPHNHIPDPHSVALARCRQLEEFPDINSLLETEYDEIKDSMPLQQRMLLGAPPQVQIPPAEPQLQSQPLSPTKLKVTRQTNKPQVSAPKVTVELPPEEVCLRWNSHHSNMQATFPQLLEKEQYIDVTLIAEGKTLKCHRMILSSCSTYFEEILNDITPLQHPVIILKGIPFWILKALTDFMYVGEVNIDQNKLPELLDIAELLKVKGLAGKSNNADQNNSNEPETPPPKKPPPPPPPARESNVRQPVIRNPPRQPTPAPARPDEMSINDPLELLEARFQEDSDGTFSKNNKLGPRKNFTRKFRKRKTSEDEPAPPLFPMRRGTRSRPNVKIPKYYDYEDIVKPTSSDIQPFSPIVNIKSEPIDVEENDISFSESTDIEIESPLIKHIDLPPEVATNSKALETTISCEPILSPRTKIVAKDKDQPPTLYRIKIKRLSSILDDRNVKKLDDVGNKAVLIKKVDNIRLNDNEYGLPKLDDIPKICSAPSFTAIGTSSVTITKCAKVIAKHSTGDLPGNKALSREPDNIQNDTSKDEKLSGILEK